MERVRGDEAPAKSYLFSSDMAIDFSRPLIGSLAMSLRVPEHTYEENIDVMGHHKLGRPFRVSKRVSMRSDGMIPAL